jgi:protein tyrosine phosphatase (PTP) superfamily phosphohydrolase (DUF442 family)
MQKQISSNYTRSQVQSCYQWLLMALIGGTIFSTIMFTATVQAETTSDMRKSDAHSNASTSASHLQEPAERLAEINNYRQYSGVYASSGQPAREQFEGLKAEGFERIIYIAFSNNGRAIADEDQLVKDLGMGYLHIPVDFKSPQLDEFETFAAYLLQAPNKKTLLHCQVNYRATAFSFLYRVIYQGVSVAQAKADMNTVWQPDAVWRDFIFAVLAEHDISPLCETCDWTPPVPD